MNPANTPVPTVGDSAATVTVLLVIVGLVALGVVLLAVAVWVGRTTRPEPEALGPLEQMGTTAWLSGDHDARRRLLELDRPVGARPLAAEAVVTVRGDLAAQASDAILLLDEPGDAPVESNGRVLAPPTMVEMFAAASDAQDEPIDALTPGFAPPYEPAE